MKRSEVTVEALKGLGYTAMHFLDSGWYMRARSVECNEKQSDDVFKAMVKIIRNGGKVEIVHSDLYYTVEVYSEELDYTNTPRGDMFYLTRTMTEVEHLEADIHTGRGQEWDFVAG